MTLAIFLPPAYQPFRKVELTIVLNLGSLSLFLSRLLGEGHHILANSLSPFHPASEVEDHSLPCGCAVTFVPNGLDFHQHVY